MEELQISKETLIQILMNIQSGTFIHLLTETKVRMNKKNNPYFDRIIKRSSCNYLTGNTYENRVMSNMEKEGLDPDTFVVEKPKGKHHISPCVLENDNDPTVKYFMVERFDEIKPQTELIDIETGLNPFIDDDPIGYELYKSFLIKQSENKKQEQERKVMVITPSIDNIKEVTLDKHHYIVVDFDTD